jgi:hypothetical protein
MSVDFIGFDAPQKLHGHQPVAWLSLSERVANGKTSA